MTVRGAVTAAMFCSCVLAAMAARAAGADQKTPRALSLQESLEKARVDGKYAMLLRQIKVESDYEQYGSFRDAGSQPAHADYHGIKNLPAGIWIYVYPYWYIWRDETGKPALNRGWGPEQAIGPPNTTGPGDIQTAWASLTPDGQDEWLLLEYAEPVLPSAVLVHETYNPGAVCRVTAFKLSGEEVEVWKGKDPTAPAAGAGVSEIAIDATFKTNRVKLYIDSKAVAGWNEIDAVGLRDGSGKTHWATAVEASSTYADQGGAVFIGVGVGPVPAPILPPPQLVNPPPAANPPPAVNPPPMPPNPPPGAGDEKARRIKRLENQIEVLKEKLQDLEDQLDKEKEKDKEKE